MSTELFRKYIDVVNEASYARDSMRPTGASADPFASDLEPELAPEIDQLESDVDNKVVSAVIQAVRDLIGQGHTDVEPSVITNMVVAATGKPFLLKDLVAVNNQSREIQHYIDSINPSKVKFSGDILTVKNEDPAKEQQQNDARVSAMAERATKKLSENGIRPGLFMEYVELVASKKQKR